MYEDVIVNSDRWFDDNDFKNEKWVNYSYKGKNYYLISNYGRLKSINRTRILFNGCKARINGKIKKATLSEKGYYSYTLNFDGKRIARRVNRMVAEKFIDNPNNLPEVNHKDENTLNNRVDNLEWCTHEYNINYGTRTIRAIKSASKPIQQYSLDGNFIKEWNSLADASKELNISRGTLCSCLKGDIKSCGGYQWKYKNSDKVIQKYKSNIIIRKIVQLDLNDNIVKIYNNLHEAERESGVWMTQIRKCCNKEHMYKTAKGFKWMWEDDYNGTKRINEK